MYPSFKGKRRIEKKKRLGGETHRSSAELGPRASGRLSLERAMWVWREVPFKFRLGRLVSCLPSALTIFLPCLQ